MAKATDKQIAMIHRLNDQLPEADRIERRRIINEVNDKHDGVALASAMIDELQAKAAALAPKAAKVNCYTPAEDAAAQPTVNERTYTRREAPWYATRNGQGAGEYDNQ